MKFIVVVVATVLLCLRANMVNSQSDCQQATEIDQYANVRSVCYKYSGLDTANYQEALADDSPDHLKAQCYVWCALVELRVLDDVNGQYTLNSTRASLVVPPAYRDRQKEISDSCVEEVESRGIEICEWAWDLYECELRHDSAIFGSVGFWAAPEIC